MTQVMSTNTVLPPFTGVLETGGERFTLHQEGNRFSVDIQPVDRPPTDTQASPVRIPMEMVTGSHYFQVFWLPGGMGNQQIGFPFTWLISEKRWVLRNDAFIRDPGTEPLPEEWNQVCIRCHATGGRPMPRVDKQEFETHVTELGIACEACHGPAERHVAAQKKLQLEGKSYLDTNAPIVQPAELDHVRSSQVCGFCHSMKWFTESEGWRQNGFRYRPGDDLEQTTPIIRANHIEQQPWLTNILSKNPEVLNDFFWPDGMMRVAGREFNGLSESASYLKGKLACVSCHSMHKSDPDKQLKKGMAENLACLQCHESFRTNLVAHTHHQPDSPGSLCYNCHMPYTAYGLLRAIRSHKIDSPSIPVTLSTGRPTACNLCHLDQTLAWTAAKLKGWFPQQKLEVPAEGSQTSAAVKALLAGDAAQRALAAYSFGWEPAQLASGTNWEAPLLAHALVDPYAAIRFIAQRSLKSLPGFKDFAYDFEAAPENLQAKKTEAVQIWRSLNPTLPRNDQILTGPGPLFDETRLREIQAQRNNRPMHLRE
jgi:predicted CXXCH cytochrome family protein